MIHTESVLVLPLNEFQYLLPNLVRSHVDTERLLYISITMIYKAKAARRGRMYHFLSARTLLSLYMKRNTVR